jgi:hypothetical protein
MVPQGAQRLTIDIWSRFGRYVRKLREEADPRPGRQVVNWDLLDDSGQRVSAGAYIYRITIDKEAESRIVFIKY